MICLIWSDLNLREISRLKYAKLGKSLYFNSEIHKISENYLKNYNSRFNWFSREGFD
jgi:hypothetical protein